MDDQARAGVLSSYQQTKAEKEKVANNQQHKEESADMENWGDGLILGALMSGRCGGFGGNCGPGYHGGHGGHCGETLEGISRTLHTNDLRNDARFGRVECRLDHIAEKVCSAKEQALELFIKAQEKENCKLQQENLFLKFLGKNHSGSDGADITIALGNTLSQLTTAVNSLVSAKQ